MAEMDREKCLAVAAELVCGQRHEDYGTVEDSFQWIANLWSAYLDREIAPRDVAAMMALMKIARIKNGPKGDNWIDLCGYGACGAELDGVD